MKKFLATVLVGAMMGTLVGCSGGAATETKAPAQTQAVAETKAPAADAGKDAAPAEAWAPKGDITIRVPNAAGGTMDTLSRIVGQGMQQTYGNTVLVNNLTGANGAIAADLLSKKGNPCEMMTTGIGLFTLAPLFNKEIQVNLDDFRIISALTSEDFLLFTAPGNSGISTWEELVEYSKDNRVVYGSNAPGGTTHMLATALFGEAGINAEAVTSDGSAKDLVALAGGNVVCAVAPSSVAQQYIEEKTMVPLLVFSEDPYTGYDGITVPTAKELGYDLVFRSCNFLMTTADVDQAIVDDIYQTIYDYCQTDEYKELMANAKIVPDYSDGAKVRETVENAADFCQKIYDTYYAK